MEDSIHSVVIRFATLDEQFLHNCIYSVVYRNLRNNSVEIQGFAHMNDAESYVFEHYAWMFIPVNLQLHEGTHLFVY